MLIYISDLKESFFKNDILFYIDEQSYLSYFPEDTTGPKFVPDKLHERYKKAVEEAIKLYPYGLVPLNIGKVYILEGSLENGEWVGVFVGDIFIGVEENYDSFLIESIFHHEFCHALQDYSFFDYNNLFNSYKAEWASINPAGFEYLGYEWFKNDKTIYDDKSWIKLLQDGFIRPYSKVNYEEDFADIAEAAFSNENDKQFLKMLKDYPKLRQKFELMVDFYNKIDPAFNMEYFEKLSGQKLEPSK